MNSTISVMPIANSGAPSDPTPYEQGVRDVLATAGLAGEVLDEAVHAISKAHYAELTLARRRVVRGEREAAAALEMAQAHELAAGHVKATATLLMDQNARLSAHVTRQTAQIQAVYDALATAPDADDGTSRLVRVVDVLAAVDRAGKPYEWPAPAPFVAGLSIDDRHHVGHFRGIKGEHTSHLFMGWAIVIHSPLQSVLEPIFRVNGRPATESQLSLSGWRLETLR